MTYHGGFSFKSHDIARYRANWAGIWLIDTHNGYADVPPIEVDRYPAVKAHLDKHLMRLERRQDKGVTPYNLRNCAYHEEFRKPKVFWMHMAPEGRFALEKEGITCNQKCFMITGENLHYLCAILNSSLVTWFVRRIAVTTGMGLPQWDKFTVERIPVVFSDESSINDFRDLVELEIQAINTGDDESAIKIYNTIDRMVFDLYGLTSQEISFLFRT